MGDRMEQKDFKIKLSYNTIVIEKDNKKISINQSLNSDIDFSTLYDDITLELNFSSRIYAEWQTYMVFENLMKSIVGGYILNDDSKKSYSRLPKDFIDLNNKTIIWHSDSGIDNVLKFEYLDSIIKISISKCKTAKENDQNSVRIRTSGSNYGYYYQEFLYFFRQLCILEQNLNNKKEKEDNKKLSLLKK